MLNVFKKKSLATLLATFVKLIEELRKLAEDKLAEAQKDEAKARELMAKVEAAEVEAEEALAAADNIEKMIGGSVVLEAATENL